MLDRLVGWTEVGQHKRTSGIKHCVLMGVIVLMPSAPPPSRQKHNLCELLIILLRIKMLWLHFYSNKIVK